MACGKCKKRVSMEVEAHVEKINAGRPVAPKMSKDSSITFGAINLVTEMDGYKQDPDNPLRLIKDMPECCSRTMLRFSGGQYQAIHFCSGNCEHKNKQTTSDTCKNCNKKGR